MGATTAVCARCFEQRPAVNMFRNSQIRGHSSDMETGQRLRERAKRVGRTSRRALIILLLVACPLVALGLYVFVPPSEGQAAEYLDAALARTPVALEEYRRTHGSYPPSSDFVLPRIGDLPKHDGDSGTLERLVYQRSPNGGSYWLGVGIVYTWSTPLTNRFRDRYEMYFTTPSGPAQALPTELGRLYVDAKLTESGRWSIWVTSDELFGR